MTEAQKWLDRWRYYREWEGEAPPPPRWRFEDGSVLAPAPPRGRLAAVPRGPEADAVVRRRALAEIRLRWLLTETGKWSG